ncbi:MAG: RNA-guided endonuclease InsQ/TnpB family protein [Candidatus Thorarchaeota archaeon]
MQNNPTIPNNPTNSKISNILRIAPQRRMIKRTISLKLLDPPVFEFQETMNAFTHACQFISKQVQDGPSLNISGLHSTFYRTLRSKFKLPSQMAQSAIRIVVGMHRSGVQASGKKASPQFNSPQLQLQYNRDWSIIDGKVSLRTLSGRRRISFITGDYQRQYLDDDSWKKGGARLVERKGAYFLHISLEREAPPTHVPKTPIGIDIGIRAFAVARAPNAAPLIIRGGELVDSQEKAHRLRRRLQAKGTRSAKRVLARISGQERRIVSDFCRKSAKKIIMYASQFDKPVLVLENLKNIRHWAKRRYPKQRRGLHIWPFRKLSMTLMMRAEERGIPVVFVDPAYTSQICPRCQSLDKRNRKRSNYFCRACGYQNNSDVIAATNIALRWFSVVYRTESGALSPVHTSSTEQSMECSSHRCQSMVGDTPNRHTHNKSNQLA